MGRFAGGIWSCRILKGCSPKPLSQQSCMRDDNERPPGNQCRCVPRSIKKEELLKLRPEFWLWTERWKRKLLVRRFAARLAGRRGGAGLPLSRMCEAGNRPPSVESSRDAIRFQPGQARHQCTTRDGGSRRLL